MVAPRAMPANASAFGGCGVSAISDVYQYTCNIKIFQAKGEVEVYRIAVRC
jgi:hypothetical protein